MMVLCCWIVEVLAQVVEHHFLILEVVSLNLKTDFTLKFGPLKIAHKIK